MKTKRKKYYHLTDVANASKILTEGIKANNEGLIFMFENLVICYNGIINTVADCIAYNQLYLEEYAVFEIASLGIYGEIMPDNVGEVSAKFQHILKQELIEKQFIKLIIPQVTTEYTPWDIRQILEFFQTREEDPNEEIKELFSILSRQERFKRN